MVKVSKLPATTLSQKSSGAETDGVENRLESPTGPLNRYLLDPLVWFD
jgi:hypothetical protein